MRVCGQCILFPRFIEPTEEKKWLAPSNVFDGADAMWPTLKQPRSGRELSYVVAAPRMRRSSYRSRGAFTDILCGFRFDKVVLCAHVS